MDELQFFWDNFGKDLSGLSVFNHINTDQHCEICGDHRETMVKTGKGSVRCGACAVITATQMRCPAIHKVNRVSMQGCKGQVLGMFVSAEGSYLFANCKNGDGSRPSWIIDAKSSRDIERWLFDRMMKGSLPGRYQIAVFRRSQPDVAKNLVSSTPTFAAIVSDNKTIEIQTPMFVRIVRFLSQSKVDSKTFWSINQKNAIAKKLEDDDFSLYCKIENILSFTPRDWLDSIQIALPAA